MKSFYSHFHGTTSQSLEEIFEAAGMNFPGGKVDMFANVPLAGGSNGDTQTVGIPQHVATARFDTGEILGVVGRDYGYTPYRSQFSILEPLIEEGTIKITGALTIAKGARAYLKGRAVGTLNLGEGNKIENIFSVCGSHDGSRNVEIQMTPVSTLDGTALPIGKPIAVKHSKHIEAHLKRVRDTIKGIRETWASFGDNVRKMASAPCDDTSFYQYLEAVLGKPTSTRSENIFEKLQVDFKLGLASKFQVTRGTMFGALQTVVYWSDHQRTMRQPKYGDKLGAEVETKLRGSGATLKSKAYDKALEVMKNQGALEIIADIFDDEGWE